MSFRQRYLRRKKELISDKNICKENRVLYKRFLDWEEDKLNKINNLLGQLDESCYNTLNGYVDKIRNVNKWFKNKPLKDIKEKDIKRVYDNIENGKVKTRFGKPLESKEDYYNKIFKSKLFALAGKKELAEKVIEFYRPNHNDDEVDYIELNTFLKLVSVVPRPVQKLLMWLCWDYGENINAMLQLIKRDFVRSINQRNEIEYRLNYRREILKRTRQKRSDINHYQETAQLLDLVLKDLKDDDDKLFNFEYRQAFKFFKRAVEISGVKTKVKLENPSWKTLRKSMACDLLNQGLSSDAVNSRLGHKASQLRHLDKYVTYFALDKNKPKEIVHQSNMDKLHEEIQQIKNREKIKDQQFEEYVQSAKENEELTRNIVSELYQSIPKFVDEHIRSLHFSLNTQKMMSDLIIKMMKDHPRFKKNKRLQRELISKIENRTHKFEDSIKELERINTKKPVLSKMPK